MRTRLFQNTANYYAHGNGFMIFRSQHASKPQLPKADLAEFVFLGIFGIAMFNFILEDGKKRRIAKLELEKYPGKNRS